MAASVWHSPSDSQYKVCVQGAMYLAFICFGLPIVLRVMETTKIGVVIDKNSYIPDQTSTDDDHTDTDWIHDTIRRLEKEVVSISDSVVSKVDLALSNIPQEASTSNFLDRIEKLENIFELQQDQFKNLIKAVEKLSEAIETKGTATLGEVNKDIYN